MHHDAIALFISFDAVSIECPLAGDGSDLDTSYFGTGSIRECRLNSVWPEI